MPPRNELINMRHRSTTSSSYSQLLDLDQDISQPQSQSHPNWETPIAFLTQSTHTKVITVALQLGKHQLHLLLKKTPSEDHWQAIGTRVALRMITKSRQVLFKKRGERWENCESKLNTSPKLSITPAYHTLQHNSISIG